LLTAAVKTPAPVARNMDRRDGLDRLSSFGILLSLDCPDKDWNDTELMST
jgi:hypothetical protein